MAHLPLAMEKRNICFIIFSLFLYSFQFSGSQISLLFSLFYYFLIFWSSDFFFLIFWSSDFFLSNFWSSDFFSILVFWFFLFWFCDFFLNFIHYQFIALSNLHLKWIITTLSCNSTFQITIWRWKIISCSYWPCHDKLLRTELWTIQSNRM